jgi:hypothetical protein
MKMHELDESYNSYHNNRTGFSRSEREPDESNLMYIYKDGKLMQNMIDNQDERQAHHQGFRDSPEAALKVHNIIRSKFKPGAWVQNQGGKWVVVHPFGKKDDVAESASAGATSSASIATVVNPNQAYSTGPVKSVNALDQDEVSLFGGPMEDIKPRKKVAIIKRR